MLFYLTWYVMLILLTCSLASPLQGCKKAPRYLTDWPYRELILPSGSNVIEVIHDDKYSYAIIFNNELGLQHVRDHVEKCMIEAGYSLDDYVANLRAPDDMAPRRYNSPDGKIFVLLVRFEASVSGNRGADKEGNPKGVFTIIVSYQDCP